jgi:glutamate racemase
VRIGIFDSGIGGLTVLRELIEALPGHELLYLGDTARVPYGTRSPDTVVRYCRRVATFLWQREVDAIVVACNTATTHAMPMLEIACAVAGISVHGVVDPGVEAAVRAHKEGAIAVLGTPGTIKGGSYQRALALAVPDQDVLAVACPLFVPLAEEGWLDGEVPALVAERYLSHLRGRADTVILGCTHYPLLAPVIQAVLPAATLVDSAQVTASRVRGLLGPGEGPGDVRFVVTDDPANFERVGSRFLGRAPRPVEWADLGAAAGPFAEPTSG